MQRPTTGLTVILNGQIFDGDNLYPDRAVIIENGVIRDVVARGTAPPDDADVVDIGGNLLLPGLIDLQVNGGGGVLFNASPTVDSIRQIGAAHRAFGTTGFLPTVLTDDLDLMRQACAAVDQAIRENVPGVLGIHLEGPYLNAAKSGIHDKSKIRRFDDDGFLLARSITRGKVIMTIAPELFDPDDIRQLVREGVIVCAGHSAATYEQARAALTAGVTGFTHLFNAMSALQSREPGLVGAALEDTDSWFGIIADGHHVHPAVFSIAVAAKQRGGVILVSDAMPTVGTQTSSFMLGDEAISVVDGRCHNARGVLAGSHLDMMAAVSNASAFAKLDWLEAVRMASLYPARALDMGDTLGRVKPGYVASLIEVDSDRNVVSSWINGERQLHC